MGYSREPRGFVTYSLELNIDVDRPFGDTWRGNLKSRLYARLPQSGWRSFRSLTICCCSLPLMVFLLFEDILNNKISLLAFGEEKEGKLLFKKVL